MLVEVTIPVYNEERDLAKSIHALTKFLSEIKLFESQIVIADNASTDHTWEIAQELGKQYANVKPFHLDQKGRGRALKAVWSESKADIVSYMDVDLSTNIKFFPLLIHGIMLGYDLATGSRLLQASQTSRCFKREVISRTYNLLVKSMFWNRFSDAQCGFKAVRREVVNKLIPLIQNNNWFFDTELMLLAERFEFKTFEVPVEWIEDLDTRVKIMRTAMEDVRGLIRVRFTNFRRSSHAQNISTYPA